MSIGLHSDLHFAPPRVVGAGNFEAQAGINAD